MKNNPNREVYVSALEYFKDDSEQNLLLKKALLGAMLTFILMLWVVFPSDTKAVQETVDGDQLIVHEFKFPEKPRQPEVRRILVRKSSIVIPCPYPDLPERSQEYQWESEERDPTDESGWIFEPTGDPIPVDGIKVAKPDCYYKPMPLYPDLARQVRLQGVVILQVEWDTNGIITKAKVLQSPGKQFGFDDAALDAVKKWKCNPATVGGRKVSVYGTVTVNFLLN